MNLNENAESPVEVLDEQVDEVTNTEVEATEVVSSPEEIAAEQAEIEAKKQSRFQRQQARYEAQLLEQKQEIEFLRKLATSGVPQQSVVEDTDNEPKIEDYEGKSITEYIEARERFLEDRLVSKAEQRAKAAYAQEQHRSLMEQKVNSFRKELPDWDEVMAAAQEDPVPPTQTTVDFIINSDIGPKIGYFLAKNPDEHERIKGLSALKQISELTRLEDRLTNNVATPVIAKKVTSAPMKLSETKGKSTVTTTDTAAAARQGYTAWKAAKEAQRALGKK